ncbi:metallophosphoesterase [Pseudomonas sp. 'CRE Jenny 4']|jgi:predicted MPP superfamily phosphohydrolase|uniref:metallophosphoesterase family protein n=1 Tax=Pseudomonas sp. 'CRE Jenny 4' TaxID=3045817 RepID=UPI002591A148|nr:metallophosphoesterase [Pseudomonas sp. 'CRE Jenny 4']
MDKSNKLHWMHISDLHRGQDRTEEVWSVVRQELYDDVKRQIDSRGPIDLVVFSGDMAFKGEADEFSSVKVELERLWEVFEQSGSKPNIFCVPGNHDLVRPGKTSALRNFSSILRTTEEIRNEILSGKPSSYRDEAEQAFANYSKFIKDLAGSAIPFSLDCQGLFPGDTSAQLSVNGLRVGLVGLNSAWTHLYGGDALGKLDISVRQLNSVVGGDLPKWSLSNHVNLLITHHPAEWFTQLAREEFEGEIFNPAYFDAHLFGHMHDNRPKLISEGAHDRRTIQVSSLFGLEKVDNKEERRHGYYFAILDANVDFCEFWPRKFEKKVGGVWQTSRDGGLLKRDENFFSQTWVVRNVKDVELKKV